MAGCLAREVMGYSGLPGSGKAALVLLVTGGESQDRAAWFRGREPSILFCPEGEPLQSQYQGERPGQYRVAWLLGAATQDFLGRALLLF